MGRRNETNRLAHKKKADDKKQRQQSAAESRKEKLKQIISKYNSTTNE